jgi:hypothetical protein
MLACVGLVRPLGSLSSTPEEEPEMKNVSSKWYVTKKEGQSVWLSPVCRGIENREWASATPGGSMQMYISNEAALGQFEVGQEWVGLLDLSPKPALGDGHPVDHYEDHPAYDPSKTIHLCRTCGSYAALNEDGSPDWSMHDEHWGSTPQQRA